MNHQGIKTRSCELYFIPISTRMPLKFGIETLTEVVLARTKVEVATSGGKQCSGWGETPLSVQWVWPGSLPYQERLNAMQAFCEILARAVVEFDLSADPIELGGQFQETQLPQLLDTFNMNHRKGKESMPWLAALVCLSAFDIAIHDAFGNVHDRSIFKCYDEAFLQYDLSRYLEAAKDSCIDFSGKYPSDYLAKTPLKRLRAWHLVGGVDPLQKSDLHGEEPDDGYPVLLRDWIRTDGLKCLKIKLRGDDAAWDMDRLLQIGQIALDEEVE